MKFHAICMQSCPSTGIIHTMHHASPESLLCSTSVGTAAQNPGWADTCMHIVAFECYACCKGTAAACIPDAALHFFNHHGSLKLSLLCCSSRKPAAAYISVLVMPSFRHAFTHSVSSSCIAAHCQLYNQLVVGCTSSAPNQPHYANSQCAAVVIKQQSINMHHDLSMTSISF